MKKRILPIIALTALASICSLTTLNSVDELRESTLIDGQKGVSLSEVRKQSEGGVFTSDQIYIQSAKHAETGNYFLRFATAVKGNVTSLEYTRTIEGTSLENPTKTQSVTTLYAGISAGDEVLYYTDEGTTSTKPESLEYYWACYTIEFVSGDYFENSISVSLKIDNDETSIKSRTAKMCNETVYSKEPTYTEVGYYNGNELPVLNDTNYTYSEDGNVATFYHEEYDLTFTKSITDRLDLGTIKYNNVSFNFMPNIENITTKYDDSNSAFIFEVAEGKEATIDKQIQRADISTTNPKGTVVFAGKGTINHTPTINDAFWGVANIIVKSGTTLSSKPIGDKARYVANQFDKIIIEEGATFNATSNNKDVFSSSNKFDGTVEVYGTLNANSNGTGKTLFMGCCNNFKVKLYDTAELNLTGVKYLIYGWSDYGRIALEAPNWVEGLPYQSDGVTPITINGLETGGGMVVGAASTLTFNQLVSKEPTYTETGLYNGKVLPVLNETNYTYSEDGNVATFYHEEYNVTIQKVINEYVKVGATTYNNVNFNFKTPSIENLTTSYDDETSSFMFKVAEGQTATIDQRIVGAKNASGAEADKTNPKDTIVFAGKGIIEHCPSDESPALFRLGHIKVESGTTLKMEPGHSASQFAAQHFDKLTIENGAILTVVTNKKDVFCLSDKDNGIVEIYGTLNVNTNGTGKSLFMSYSNDCKVRLFDTAELNLTGVGYVFYSYNGKTGNTLEAPSWVNGLPYQSDGTTPISINGNGSSVAMTANTATTGTLSQ